MNERNCADELPDIEILAQYKEDPPEVPEEVIRGILRQGHKMPISGCSKAGKSFLLMELAVAISEGESWIGFPCKKGRVLYVNLEIDPASAITRFLKIYQAMGLEPRHMDDILIWNLRGYALPLDQLVPRLIERVQELGLDAIILDPIYKVITGDENNASEMGYFSNQFDKLCSNLGCAVIYCHHHSKGAQGTKRAMDRASGSGVFARDPDAQLDMIQLELPRGQQVGNKTAWRVEGTLREFPPFHPVDIWYDYPLHHVDLTGQLAQAHAEGSPGANLSRSSKRTSAEERRASLGDAFEALSVDPPVKITALAERMKVDEKTVRRYLKEFKTDYWLENGIAGRKNTFGQRA